MKDIKKISDKDLIKALEEKRKAVRDIRFGASGAKAKNVKETKVTRKDIARILTEINARASEATAK
jgi:ribosomal protein L29